MNCILTYGFLRESNEDDEADDVLSSVYGAMHIIWCISRDACAIESSPYEKVAGQGLCRKASVVVCVHEGMCIFQQVLYAERKTHT